MQCGDSMTKERIQGCHINMHLWWCCSGGVRIINQNYEFKIKNVANYFDIGPRKNFFSESLQVASDLPIPPGIFSKLNDFNKIIYINLIEKISKAKDKNFRLINLRSRRSALQNHLCFYKR